MKPLLYIALSVLIASSVTQCAGGLKERAERIRAAQIVQIENAGR